MQIFYSDDDRTDRKRLASILTAFTLSFIFNLLSAKCIYSDVYFIRMCIENGQHKTACHIKSL